MNFNYVQKCWRRFTRTIIKIIIAVIAIIDSDLVLKLFENLHPSSYCRMYLPTSQLVIFGKNESISYVFLPIKYGHGVKFRRAVGILWKVLIDKSPSINRTFKAVHCGFIQLKLITVLVEAKNVPLGRKRKRK